MKFYENNKRSFVKSITFRGLILIADFIIITAITHRYDLALGVVLFSNISSTVLYFFHERIWNGTDWGRKKNS